MSRRKTPASNSRLSMPKRYFAAPHFLLQPSPDFGNRAPFDVLSRPALRTLFFLMAQYRGNNNGDLSIAPKLCRDYNIGRTTARKGLCELAYFGLVVETRQGALNRCGLYALAWLGIDDEVSHKFDDGIKASSIPLQAWTLQHRNKRTKHLVDEYQRTRDKRTGGRWTEPSKKNPLHPRGGKESADLQPRGGKASIRLAHP